MKKFTAALACALTALALVSSAQADTVFGVADDTGKYADNPGAFFDTLRDVGMTENRMTVIWDPAQPTSIVETGFLARSLPAAQARGINVVFSIYPLRARALADDPNALAQFTTFLQQVARAYPQVNEFIVGNEFNQPRFLQPCDQQATIYARMLAAGYDALKAVRPNITVISSLSPRGNDNCSAAVNPSHSPVQSIHDLGVAYRGLGRNAPLFDMFGYHPYPNESTDPLSKGYQWPNAGIANLDRIKQALWDAFNGTAQRTVEQGLKFKLAEVGWQVGVVPSAQGAYTGRENVAVTDEATQASIYGDIVRQLVCDPSIQSVLFFGLIDEPNLDRFQAALMRADGTKRPSYDAVKAAIAQTGRRCAGAPVSWAHRTDVAAAKAVWSGLGPKRLTTQYWAHNVYAEEDATYVAGLFRVASATSKPSGTPVLATSGTVKAYFTPLVKYPAKKLPAGFYAYGITLKATMNPARTSSFTSPAFRVGTGKVRTTLKGVRARRGAVVGTLSSKVDECEAGQRVTLHDSDGDRIGSDTTSARGRFSISYSRRHSGRASVRFGGASVTADGGTVECGSSKRSIRIRR